MVPLPPPKSKREQRPGTHYSDTVDCILAERKVVGCTLAQSRLLEEIARIIRERISTEILDRPARAHNLNKEL